MFARKLFFASLALSLLASLLSAQLPPADTGTLRPGQAIQGTAGCSATDASSCTKAAAKITPIVMGDSPMEDNLRRLTDDIGGRVSGSSQMAKAVDWAVAAFRAGGVEVHTEKDLSPGAWGEGETREEVVARVRFPGSRGSTGLSPATPPEGVEATLIDVGYGATEDFARANSSLKGAILLVHSDIGYTWADLFDEYLRPPDIISQALKGGAVAILWLGARVH